MHRYNTLKIFYNKLPLILNLLGTDTVNMAFSVTMYLQYLLNWLLGTKDMVFLWQHIGKISLLFAVLLLTTVMANVAFAATYLQYLIYWVLVQWAWHFLWYPAVHRKPVSSLPPLQTWQSSSQSAGSHCLNHWPHLKHKICKDLIDLSLSPSPQQSNFYHTKGNFRMTSLQIVTITKTHPISILCHP